MPTVPAADLVHRTRRALLDFYDGAHRELPWRAGSDPYRIWISAVMLQQTRVEAVVPYYRAWMERFPDVGALAAAPLGEVLRMWEGLGYYARARNLHRAALMVRDRMGTDLPATATALRELPGVGEYTAGAVASIAFGERVPAVDGNVRRVLARLFDKPSPTPSWLREHAGALVDPDRPGDFNQALMELGATVCRPRLPHCDACPVARDCRALLAGTASERPPPRRRTPIPEVEVGVAVLLRAAAGGGQELLLSRRPSQGLLGGLWELPGVRVGDDGAEAAARRAARDLALEPTGPATALPVMIQAYSHFHGVYRPFLWQLGSVPDGTDAAGGSRPVWVDAGGLAARALPAAQRRIAGTVATSHLRNEPSVAGRSS